MAVKRLHYKQRDLIEHNQMVDRILTQLRGAKVDHWDQGLDWYKNANLMIRKLAAKHKKSIGFVAAVCAVLSTNTRWETNFRMLEHYLETGEVGHLSIVKGQIKKLEEGFHPEKVLRGDKIGAFYFNLLNPYTNGPVTVDRWIYLAIYGKIPKGTRPKLNRRVQEAFLEACRILNEKYNLRLLPHMLQAILWGHIRGSLA